MNQRVVFVGVVEKYIKIQNIWLIISESVGKCREMLNWSHYVLEPPWDKLCVFALLTGTTVIAFIPITMTWAIIF